jgi:hypothetical protein
VWNEQASGSSNVTVLEEAKPAVDLYDPTTGASPTQRLENVRAVPLTLSDHLVIIELPVGGAKR